MKNIDFFALGIEKAKVLYNDYEKLGEKIKQAYGAEAKEEYDNAIVSVLFQIIKDREPKVKKHK